jgi:hypothetical protein
MPDQPGRVVLFGSGETSPSGRRIFDWLLSRLPSPVRLAILETPAGFELNSAQVAGRIAEFLCHHLQNYQPQITIVPARKHGTPFSPDAPEIAALIPGADAIFLGPGSPTYAVRQLQDSLTWHTTIACHHLGSAVVLASAAAIAASAYALPVYEIYKVGEDPHWRGGLDLLGPYGLSLVFVPHWDNQDGGDDLDTSHCYMGKARFDLLLDMLPSGVTVVGIDEHTALAIDLAAETCQIVGKDGVTLWRDGSAKRYGRGATFAIGELGSFHRPDPESGLPAGFLARAGEASLEVRRGPAPEPSLEVLALVRERERARARRDWARADALRASLADLGWQVQDTPGGPQLEPAEGVPRFQAGL